jgi:hypothetical protein
LKEISIPVSFKEAIILETASTFLQALKAIVKKFTPGVTSAFHPLKPNLSKA